MGSGGVVSIFLPGFPEYFTSYFKIDKKEHHHQEKQTPYIFGRRRRKVMRSLEDIIIAEGDNINIVCLFLFLPKYSSTPEVFIGACSATTDCMYVCM